MRDDAGSERAAKIIGIGVYITWTKAHDALVAALAKAEGRNA